MLYCNLLAMFPSVSHRVERHFMVCKDQGCVILSQIKDAVSYVWLTAIRPVLTWFEYCSCS